MKHQRVSKYYENNFKRNFQFVWFNIFYRTISLIFCNEGLKPTLHCLQSFNIICQLFSFLFSNRDFSSRSQQCLSLFLDFESISKCCFWHSTGFCGCTYWFSFTTNIKCTFYISLIPVAFASFCCFSCSLAYSFRRKKQNI